MSVGKKYDQGKLRWDLLPIAATREIVRVLTFGADKYGAENWCEVDEWRRRYYAAALRHLTSWYEGEKYDQETGIHHLAHAGCCLVFLLTKDV